MLNFIPLHLKEPLPNLCSNWYFSFLSKTGLFSSSQVAQIVAVSSGTSKVCGFDSWSGHIPRLQVRSLVRVCMRSNQLMFLSHTEVSLSLTVSLKSVNISSGKAFKKQAYTDIIDM